MSHTDYRALIDMGRKAGLRTSELYTALASRPPETTDANSGQADGNGFISGLDSQGHRTFTSRKESR